MRIITLEEHVIFPEMGARVHRGGSGAKGGRGGQASGSAAGPFAGMAPEINERLADVSGERLQRMENSGISMQVLSVIGPGAQLLEPEEGPAFARDYNDILAEKIRNYPDRLAAFAHLPMTAPHAAADELERTARELRFRGALISGLTRDEFLDHPRYAPLLQRAEALGLPLYLHPGLPPKAVADAYYGGLPGSAGTILSVAGWGWHAETALHVLRLIVSGTLDRYPRLQLIIGHMGEMLPMMMARCDKIFKPGTAGTGGTAGSAGTAGTAETSGTAETAETVGTAGTVGANGRTISQTLRDQVYVTTSGMFSWPPLQAALATFGIDRIMFSVDYPFSTMEEGRSFLGSLPLAPADVEKIAHGNAERVLKL